MFAAAALAFAGAAKVQAITTSNAARARFQGLLDMNASSSTVRRVGLPQTGTGNGLNAGVAECSKSSPSSSGPPPPRENRQAAFSTACWLTPNGVPEPANGRLSMSIPPHAFLREALQDGLQDGKTASRQDGGAVNR